MKKYKVEFSGFVYVEAEDEEDAKEKYNDGETIYEESEVNSVKQVSDFHVSLF